MVDHHVDRPDVKARQRVQLTGPNRSIGLISSSAFRAQRQEQKAPAPYLQTAHCSSDAERETRNFRPDDLVALARGQTPDPIPNSAVKTLRAHGTASQDAGESVVARSSRRKSRGADAGGGTSYASHPRFHASLAFIVRALGALSLFALRHPVSDLRYRGVEQPGSSSGS